MAQVGDVEPPAPVCNETTRSGSLTSGGSVYAPSTTGFSAAAGTVHGCLDGPDGADFDLLLQRQGILGWSTVARAESPGPDEEISYAATAGTYRWRVYAYSGSGPWTLGYDVP